MCPSIAELLLKESLITSQQFREALDHLGHHGGTLSRALVTLGFVKDRDIANLLSVHCCVPTIDIEDFEVSSAIARILPVEMARKHQALPLARLGATLAIATADPTNAGALEDIRLLTGHNLELFVAAESALEDAIERCYGGNPPTETRSDTSAGSDGQESVDRPLRRSDPRGLVDIDLDVLPGAALQGQGQDDGAAGRVQSERTAWAYVTAMHAAAVGGPRTPIRGIVEDVEDMRATLIRERDEARDRASRLERQLGRRRWWREVWCAACQRTGIERARALLVAAWRLLAGAICRPVAAPAACADRGLEPREPRSADDRELIDVHLAEGRTETKAPAKARITLGELLMERGLVSLEQCLEALRDQKRNGGDLGTALVRLGFVKDEEITAVFSAAYGIPSIRLDHFEVHPAVLEVLAPETARRYQVLPLCVSSTLTLAVADPADQLAMDTIRSLTGWNVEPVVASAAALHAALDRYYGSTGSPGRAARPRAERGLRLVWSGQRPRGGRDDTEGDGGPSAA